jgi:hypothetical protein
MNPAQQQFLQQWQGWLQQVGAQASQILQEADQGCRGLIAQHPTDPMPMSNALQAIHIQLTELNTHVSNAWSQQIEHIAGMGATREVVLAGQKANEDLELWIMETWARFRSQWRVEMMKVFWQHVQQQLAAPVQCSQCGSPITPNLRHVSDTVTCTHCGGVNQVTPHPDVAMFYATGPEVWADAATLDKRFAIDRHRKEAGARLRENNASFNISMATPEEPLESLNQWETMERDYWTTYFAAKAQLLPSTVEDQALMVEARMKTIVDELKRSNAWRKSKGMEDRVEIARTPGVIFGAEDWGPLRPDQFEEFHYQAFMLDDSRDDPPRFRALLQRFGYRDNEQFEAVRLTFNKHIDLSNANFMQQQMNARQRATADGMADKAQSHPLLQPVDGVTIDQYGQFAAAQAAGISLPDFQRMLAQHGLDQARYDRVAAEWNARMSRDTDFVVVTAYGKAFNAKPGGGVAGAAPGIDPNTVSFDTFCEIMGAQSAWSAQGKDVNAMLKQVFNMTAADWSNVSAVWTPKMMTDMSLGMRMSDLMMRAQAKYMMT